MKYQKATVEIIKFNANDVFFAFTPSPNATPEQAQAAAEAAAYDYFGGKQSDGNISVTHSGNVYTACCAPYTGNKANSGNCNVYSNGTCTIFYVHDF